MPNFEVVACTTSTDAAAPVDLAAVGLLVVSSPPVLVADTVTPACVLFCDPKVPLRFASSNRGPQTTFLTRFCKHSPTSCHVVLLSLIVHCIIQIAETAISPPVTPYPDAVMSCPGQHSYTSQYACGLISAALLITQAALRPEGPCMLGYWAAEEHLGSALVGGRNVVSV